MLFSPMTFVFLFLPIVCVLYALAGRGIRNYILLIASILFYAWGEPRYMAVMLLTILISYLGGLLVSLSRYRRTMLLLTILGNLSFLVYFKYFNFLAGNINALIGGHIDFIKVVISIGISFYTFQALSYVIDVYRGEAEVQRNVFKLALFITLFPQLVAGPIVQYHATMSPTKLITVRQTLTRWRTASNVFKHTHTMLYTSGQDAMNRNIFIKNVSV